LILNGIVRALESLNTKLDAVLEGMGPMTGNMKQALMNCAFDKDLISHLMQVSSKNLINLETEAYAKYVEGMTHLASKRGNQEAQAFLETMKKLEKKIPDTFITDVQIKNAEIQEWQKAIEVKMLETQELHVALKRQLDEFKEMAKGYGAKVKGAAKSATMAAEQTRTGGSRYCKQGSYFCGD